MGALRFTHPTDFTHLSPVARRMGKAQRAHAVRDLMGALRFTHPTMLVILHPPLIPVIPDNSRQQVRDQPRQQGEDGKHRDVVHSPWLGGILRMRRFL